MRFSKMQGIGNDFVVVSTAALPADNALPSLAVKLCDRHFGVGADGLLVLDPEAGEAAFTMRMFNPDGTEDMCGNGLRCAALWAYRAGWMGTTQPFCVATKEGAKSLALLSVDKAGRSAIVRVGMGLPKFEPSDIPFCGNVKNAHFVKGYPLTVDDAVYNITSLNTGSTHTVIFGPARPDEATFQRVSPLIECHPLFPERTSVLWAWPGLDGAVGVRIWERGVGETLGCGTGACAVGIAALDRGRVAPPGPSVRVRSQGGVLEITWHGRNSPVWMTGPAEFVYDGEFLAPKPSPALNRETEF